MSGRQCAQGGDVHLAKNSCLLLEDEYKKAKANYTRTAF